MKNYYYILGLKENSSIQDIKKAYRKLSKKFHPDINNGDDFFEERFKEIQEAYETLSDTTRRDQYDSDRFNHEHKNRQQSQETNNKEKRKKNNKHQRENYKREQENREQERKRKKENDKIYNAVQSFLMILFALCSVYAIVDII